MQAAWWCLLLPTMAFTACYVLGGKPEARVSAVNMTLKLGEVDAALREYDRLLATGTLGAKAEAVVVRKREEAALQRGGAGRGRKASSQGNRDGVTSRR